MKREKKAEGATCEVCKVYKVYRVNKVFNVLWMKRYYKIINYDQRNNNRG